MRLGSIRCSQCLKNIRGAFDAPSIAAGHSWCGKSTKSGSVLYIAAEGVLGLRLRVQAYQRKHAIFAEQIRYLGDAFDLRRIAEVEELISTLEEADFRPCRAKSFCVNESYFAMNSDS
jgi:hypothetical protein